MKALISAMFIRLHDLPVRAIQGLYTDINTKAVRFQYKRKVEWDHGMQTLAVIASILILHCCLAMDVNMVIEYTTDGPVLLDMFNITFQTVELHVTLLGCDYGYYDQYLLTPPTVPSVQTEITPFNCLECVCTRFDSVRDEPIVAID